LSIEGNKKIAGRLVRGLANPEYCLLDSILHEDAVWTVMADPDSFPVTGPLPKDEFIQHMGRFHRLAPNGIEIAITGMTAEDNRVAVEAISHAVLTNGRTLNQVYHFLFEIEGDLVVNAREYIDTAHGVAVFS
jgi:ketosteroid isomerase-like protein